MGRRLARRLRTSWDVLAIVRSDESAALLRTGGVTVLRADFDRGVEPGLLQSAAGDAAIAYLAPPPDSGSADPRLAGFLSSLGNAQPRVLLYMSTTGVYGDTGGALVTEDTAVAPANDRSRRRIAAERTAMDWCSSRGTRCVILRVPGIYGPGRLPLERLRRDEPAIRSEDAGPGNRIHVDDLVAACVAAIERPVTGVVNVCDGDYSSTTVFLQRTAALAGLPPPRLVSIAEARGQISPGMLAFLVEPRRVDNRRMLGELGVQLAYPNVDAGITASLAEMRHE